jgi:hypothetical protein
MSQMTIYLDDKLERQVKRSAKAEGISVSKWIAQRIHTAERDNWPADVLASFGTWNDVPDLDSIRASYGEDSPSEEL